jgi:hypothetical protein
MTRKELLFALGAAGTGMVVASGVAAWAAAPGARTEALALWALWWCLVAAVLAGLGLFWWEDEAEPAEEDD